MPANKKHLTTSFHQRFAKITAGFVGGYIINATLFLLLATFIQRAAVLTTMRFSGFLIWCVLMIIPFMFRNGWRAWLIYLFTSAFLVFLFYMVTSELPAFLPLL